MPTINIPDLAERNKIGVDAAYPLDGDYLQTADIDATAGLTVIGTGTGGLRFTGIYNGGGFATTNCTIDTPLVDYVGFFGSTVGATISNISDIAGSFTGQGWVGALVGRAEGGSIANCYATGAATATTNFAGGLVGVNLSSATIANCYATGAATSTNFAGGLVGINDASSTIANCYATGAATATTSYAGGLVGYNSTSATITNCYATGAATATNYAGGLVGYNTTSAIYEASFASGNFSGAYSTRLCGRDLTTEISTGAHLTVAQMQSPRQFLAFGWDYAATWVQPVVMPTITGLTVKAAQDLLCPIGCDIGAETTTYHATVPADQIISQSIAAGGTADYPQLQAFGIPASPKTGDVVDVTVSLGNQVEVPNVLGLTEADATSYLSDFYFGATVTEASSSDFAAGLVISQTPAAGTSAAYESDVAITVSTGPAQVTVPDVVGSTTAAATVAIEAVGLTATPTTAYSTSVAIGKVISQSPAASATVDTGSAIAIVSSLGTQVPNVVDDYYLCAQSLIESESLVYASTMAYSATVAAGYIISQSPAAGEAVVPGSTVTATISRGATTGPLMYTLNTIKTVLSRSSAFRTWAGVATEALALDHIGILALDADYLPMAVVSPGAWEREVSTLNGDYLTKPVVVIEFCKSVTRPDSEASVFATIVAAVDSVMLEIEAQGLWYNLKWSPLNDDTPRRAGYSASTADWVSFSIVIEGDENEEI